RIGQRLLHDAIHRELPALRHDDRFAVDLEHHRHTGRADLLDQLVQFTDPGLRREGPRVVVLAQDAEEPPHLRQRHPSSRGDRGKRLAGPHHVGVDRIGRAVRLHHDHADVVGNDVVQFPCDARPFGGHGHLDLVVAIALQPFRPLLHRTQVGTACPHVQAEEPHPRHHHGHHGEHVLAVTAAECVAVRGHDHAQFTDERRRKTPAERIGRRDRVQAHQDGDVARYYLHVQQALDGRDERDRGEDGTREGAAQDERTDQPYRQQREQPRTGPRATARHRGQGDHQQRRRVERIDERLLGPQPVPRARHHTDRVRTPRPPQDQPQVGHLLRRKEEPGYAHVGVCLWGHTWGCNDAYGTGTQGNVAVVAALVSEWLTWRTAMERALYGENGFYRRGERPAEHFRTSVHASPRFAAAIARLLVEVDELLGRPERLDIVDIGAGSGHLVSNILALAPPSLAARLAPTAVEIAPRPPDLSPRIDWRPDLPSSITGLAVANEWLDNIPLDVVEQTPDGVRTVLVDPSTGS